MRLLKRPGLTLIEVLVALGLAGVVLTLLVQILVPGLQIWRHTQAVSELEQNAMIARARVEDALLNTVAESITVIDRTDRQAFSCLDNEGTEAQSGYDGSTGDIFWRSMTAFSLNPAEGALRRYRRQLPAIVNEPFAYTSPQLDSFLNEESGQLVASKVTTFRLLPPPDEEQLWHLQLSLEGRGPRGAIVLEREMSILPRIQTL
ncbi:MAG: type II secretion system protein [Vulcanimicrobiota bacterium]